MCHPEVSATGVPDDRGGTSYGNLSIREIRPSGNLKDDICCVHFLLCTGKRNDKYLMPSDAHKLCSMFTVYPYGSNEGVFCCQIQFWWRFTLTLRLLYC